MHAVSVENGNFVFSREPTAIPLAECSDMQEQSQI